MLRTKMVLLGLTGSALLYFLTRVAISPRTRGDIAWTIRSWVHPADEYGRRLQD